MHKLDRAMACGRTKNSLYAFRATVSTENQRWLIKDSGSTSGKRLHLWQHDFIYCCIYIQITKMSPKRLCRDSRLPFTITSYNPRLAAKAVVGSVHIFRLWVSKNSTVLCMCACVWQCACVWVARIGIAFFRYINLDDSVKSCDIIDLFLIDIAQQKLQHWHFYILCSKWNGTVDKRAANLEQKENSVPHSNKQPFVIHGLK